MAASLDERGVRERALKEALDGDHARSLVWMTRTTKMLVRVDLSLCVRVFGPEGLA